MSNYNSLKTTIDANIKQNGRQEITGQILNSVLNQMVTTLGAGYQFAGVATLDPATDPGTPDAKVFYIANGKGTYTNFGGVEVTEDDVVVLYWDSSWHKVSTGIASQEKLTELVQEIKDYGQEVSSPEIIIRPLIAGSIYYKFDAPRYTAACIGFFDNTDTIIGSWIGQPSSSELESSYEGVAQVPNGAVYLKASTTGDGFVIDHLYYIDSAAGKIQELSEKIDYKVQLAEQLSKDYGQVVAETKEILRPLRNGEILYYKFSNPANLIGCIGFFDSSNNRVGDWIGQPSSGQASVLYEGTVNIPQQAAYLKAATSGAGFTIDSLYYVESPYTPIREVSEENNGLNKRVSYIEDNSWKNTDYRAEITSIVEIVKPVIPGKTLYYEFLRPASTIACIGIYDDDDNLIGDYIGAHYSTGDTKGFAGTVLVPQNAKHIRAITNTGGSFTIDHLYYTDSLVSKVELNTKKLAPYISLVSSEGSIHAAKSVLFTSGDVNVGQVIYYSIRNSNNASGYIDLLDANGQRLVYYGIGSSDIAKTVSGTFVVPDGFATAIANGTQALTVFYLRYRVNSNPTNNEIDVINNRLFRNNCWLDNRLANPLHTSREKFNKDNPETPIVDETAMSIGTGISELRIPVSIVTNAGSVLVAATASASGSVEHGQTSIDVARKASGGNSWNVTRVFEFGSTYGQFWNLSLVVDRTGAHGTAGRIYIFSACGKGAGGAIVSAADISYENADLLYSYSDDDGVTWSSPASLKSLWTSEQYNMVTPAPNAGIQLTDGTLVVPLFNLKNGNITSGILYKKSNGNWTISSAVPTEYTYGNECVAVEVSSNIPTLFLRNETEKDYSVDNPNYIHGIGIQIWEYSFTNDGWTKKDSDFVHSTPCQFSIIKSSINGKTIYLQSGIAGNGRPYRYYPTVWASSDCMTWIRVYRMYNGSTAGYSSLGYYDGKLVVSYETNGNNIKFQDITNVKQLLLDSVDSFINYEITIQDRMQMLFDKLNGID